MDGGPGQAVERARLYNHTQTEGGYSGQGGGLFYGRGVTKILREVFEMAIKELYTPSNYGTMDGDIIRLLKDSIRLDLRIIFNEVYGVSRSSAIDVNSAAHIIKSMPVNLIADYPQGLNYPPSPIDLDNGYIDDAYAPYTKLRSFTTDVLLPVELIDSGNGFEEAVKHLPVAELYASIQDIDTGDLWGSVQETITFSKYREATYNSGYGSFAMNITTPYRPIVDSELCQNTMFLQPVVIEGNAEELAEILFKNNEFVFQAQAKCMRSSVQEYLDKVDGETFLISEQNIIINKVDDYYTHPVDGNYIGKVFDIETYESTFHISIAITMSNKGITFDPCSNFYRFTTPSMWYVE